MKHVRTLNVESLQIIHRNVSRLTGLTASYLTKQREAEDAEMNVALSGGVALHMTRCDGNSLDSQQCTHRCLVFSSVLRKQKIFTTLDSVRNALQHVSEPIVT